MEIETSISHCMIEDLTDWTILQLCKKYKLKNVWFIAKGIDPTNNQEVGVKLSGIKSCRGRSLFVQL